MNGSAPRCARLMFENCDVSVVSLTLQFFSVPLYVFVLYLWQRRRCPAAVASHADVFTYNMVVANLLELLGMSLHLASTFAHLCSARTALSLASTFVMTGLVPGQTLFHVFTCVDRYLAVAHPVAYLGLRARAGVRVRNASIGGVWLLSAVVAALGFVSHSSSVVLALVLSVAALLAVLHCCLSVLRVLIRRKPGDVGGAGQRADQWKKKAFHTMVAVMAALLLRFLAKLASDVLSVFREFDHVSCSVLVLVITLHLPSSLVLPLLYLHRAGKLPRCRARVAAA